MKIDTNEELINIVEMPPLPCEWKICTEGFRTAENKNPNDFKMISEKGVGDVLKLRYLDFHQLFTSYAVLVRNRDIILKMRYYESR